jgi:hypothetical protein
MLTVLFYNTRSPRCQFYHKSQIPGNSCWYSALNKLIRSIFFVLWRDFIFPDIVFAVRYPVTHATSDTNIKASDISHYKYLNICRHSQMRVCLSELSHSFTHTDADIKLWKSFFRNYCLLNYSVWNTSRVLCCLSRMTWSVVYSKLLSNLCISFSFKILFFCESKLDN